MIADATLRSQGSTRWADLGAGDGTFTLALAESLQAGSIIHAVDRDGDSLTRIPTRHHEVVITTHSADFTQFPWAFGKVDGILMANSLHFVANQPAFLRSCETHLSRPGCFLIVEYDTDVASPWVPYPISRRRLAELFVGYVVTCLGRRPSRYQRAELYAASVADREAPFG
jgi:ubiquinone/menaquinone biosynthesis C-methylase UbiE